MIEKRTARAGGVVTLTDEQEQVVNHDHGPALVFAVAGAGKTTSMVRRIERLVREGVFLPERILATSFSRATVADLKEALRLFPHAGRVTVKTLHGLAHSIILEAVRAGASTNLKLPENMDGILHVILNRALTTARASQASFAADLESLDREDFFAYVGGCKATLAFVDLKTRGLPKGTAASQAKAPAPLRWYLDLYALFERERKEMGVLTFDDLVPEAWALLVQHEHLARTYQEQFDAVLVDEFQDTNLSQVTLLDVLVEGHKNIMVCGDDDQSIYGFRKASNRFILEFGKRYGARRYVISDNFRCFAEHTILANHVISRNKARVKKLLSPTRGFGGQTVIQAHDTSEAMGREVAAHIREAITAGTAPDDIAVLVRLYAETGVIENALIDEGVPYVVVGNAPFYARLENQLLLKYLRLALLERRIAAGELDASVRAALSEVWWDVLRVPWRYLRRETSDALLREVMVGGTPPSVVLMTSKGTSRYGRQKVMELGRTLAWLAEVVESPEKSAHAVLMELEQRLEYKQFLVDSSGFVETGQGRAQTVEAFIEYAKEKGNAAMFLAHVERISFGAAGRDKNDKTPRVVISSVFRAKGLEWPVVIIPAVNYGHYPAASQGADLSEERRLFYVALTRSKSRLELHVMKNRPPSVFMEGLAELSGDASRSAQALRKHVLEWEAADALAVVRVYRHLTRFVARWGGLGETERVVMASWLLAANKAWGLASRAPLSLELEQELAKVASVDEEKVVLCAQALGVGGRLDAQPTVERLAAQAPLRKRYDVTRDGLLERGTRVWHKLHGEGKIMGFGEERGLEFVEVAFDRGRTVKLPLAHAVLEIVK
jgi:DNA helicase-2/ATP-dependent DNA helicase PcrA